MAWKQIVLIQLFAGACFAESFYGLFPKEDRDIIFYNELETAQSGSDVSLYSHKDVNSTCKDHNEQCRTDDDCCAIPSMICWHWNETIGIPNPPPYPMCKCDYYYQWDEKNWRCYPFSLSRQMMIAALMAFSCAILVALIAFCIHSCKYCWTYRDRIRYMREIRRDRRHRRRQVRLPRDQYGLNAFAEINPDHPVKLPTYEEIGTHQVLYASTTTTLPSAQALSGTLRSLPPAYETIIVEGFIVPSEATTDTTSGFVEEQAASSRTDQRGQTNQAYETENHI
ncbi:uncharacterized protein LOC132204858 [Neocloeon triangulifer]|uniref:uncharacterized protein LOC132204858 n=1 Tax=Neocloeon triangulifer TaxID=2078957 RepID=UPI00286F21E9|nr:uncharacterized protein LOC132204858 [Neocloeon triangulifer]